MPSIDQRSLDKIPGWLSPTARVLTAILIDLQRERGDVTGVLELGVYKGKYLSVLTRCVQGLNVPVVGVDAFLERPKRKLTAVHRSSAERQIHEAIASITGEPSQAVLIASYTQDVDLGTLMKIATNRFSFISVDAGHDASDLVTDMEIADRALSPKGITAVDDVYNETTPGVAEGFFRYFQRTPEVNLAPFATGGNKVFMCRREQHDAYFRFALSIAEKARLAFPAISGTTRRLRENQGIGWSPHLLDFKIDPSCPDRGYQQRPEFFVSRVAC